MMHGLTRPSYLRLTPCSNTSETIDMKENFIFSSNIQKNLFYLFIVGLLLSVIGAFFIINGGNGHAEELHSIANESHSSFQWYHRLFSNLLHNALNYTPENGFVLVFLQQHNHSVKVFVDDTGVGIASEDIPRVFDRFWRADKARNSSGGSGLGLSIAQSIAHSHQGNITVSSTLGVGTRFEVSLPIL